MYELHLFAGSGGGILGGLLGGATPVGAVEIEDYCRRNLVRRQRDGWLPAFPIWDDVRSFRADNPDCAEYIAGLRAMRSELRICGGFPCQDISVAGKGAGIDGERSGLWREFARIIGEIRPAEAFVENSPMLLSARTGKGLLLQVVDLLFGKFRSRKEIDLRLPPDALRVLGDLAEMGYDATWGVVSAADAGTCHERARVWIYAFDPDCGGWAECPGEATSVASGHGPQDGLSLQTGLDDADANLSRCATRCESTGREARTDAYRRSDRAEMVNANTVQPGRQELDTTCVAERERLSAESVD